MNIVVATLVLALGGMLVAQAVPTLLFAVRVFRRNPQKMADQACPQVLVVLCLRGRDPFLADCLRGLFQQDYPHYTVRIIVDSREDPAWQVVQQAMDEYQPAHVRLEALERRIGSCALKCSGLVQGASRLEPSDEVMALLDADTIPHRTWLRELVAPLTDHRVGVASGNRWYMPPTANWGSLVRFVWNAAAVVQMYFNRFTWGGAVAIRGSLVRESDLLERWSTSISSDTVIYEAARKLGLRVAFVPSVMMVNRESCTLMGFFRWVQRQLLVARLYHPRWPIVLLHGIGTTAVIGVALVALLVNLFLPFRSGAIWLGAALGVYLAGMLLLLLLMEAGIRRLIHDRGEEARWLTLPAIVKLLLALPLTQFLYAAALVQATPQRIVEWRGVTYRVDGPGQVRMIQYRPYRADAPAAESLASL